MKSFFKAKVKCNRVQETSVHLIVQITEIKVQYYSVRMTYLPEILFTRIYLGEKCKYAVFLKKNTNFFF